MKIKTSDLQGIALDFMVAKAGGGKGDVWNFIAAHADRSMYHYSSDWARGGPIIEREGIDLWCNTPSSIAEKHSGWTSSWRACFHRCGVGTEPCYGLTPLIAAMRCYVASKLGDEVDVPEELL